MSTAAREEGFQAERIEMSLSCLVRGGGLLGTLSSRTGLGEEGSWLPGQCSHYVRKMGACPAAGFVP